MSRLKGFHHLEETKRKIAQSHLGLKPNEATLRKLSESHKGQISGFKNKHHTEEAKEKNRIAHLGKTPWIKGKKHSSETIARLKIINKAKALRGPNNPCWKGGTGTERHRLMGQIEYKLWRKAVFERDNYTCQLCFVKGVYLEADHIKSWASYPELRYAIDNGRTLCKKCHILTESYPKQLIPKIFRRIEL